MLPENQRRHIPAEIVEQILLNLPLKSLLRFSAVSKSWKSMISETGFVRRYRGRTMVVICPWRKFLDDALASPLSSVEDQPIKDGKSIICPIRYGPRILLAFCDEFWIIQVINSLFLWNPSINTYKKLFNLSVSWLDSSFACGLGYCPIGDDYKILMINDPDPWGINFNLKTNLYSLKTDSWKRVEPFPGRPVLGGTGRAVNGKLYWMVHRDYPDKYGIIYFDLSTEKYGEVALPDWNPTETDQKRSELIVLRGMLCFCVNYCNYNVKKLVVWVMEEYGSWNKMFEFNYDEAIATHLDIDFEPFYLYDNGEILIRVSSIDDPFASQMVFILYKDEKTIPRVIVARGGCSKIEKVFLYVESLELITYESSIYTGNSLGQYS